MRSCSFSEAGVLTTAWLGLIAGAADGMLAIWNRLMSPQAASVAATHSRAGAAQSRRLIPSSRRPASPSTSSYSYCYYPGGSVSAQHFDLPAPDHFNPWAWVRLDPTTNPNPPILERLKGHAGGFDRRHIAP